MVERAAVAIDSMNIFVRDLKGKSSVATKQVQMDSLFIELWTTRNSIALEGVCIVHEAIEVQSSKT